MDACVGYACDTIVEAGGSKMADDVLHANDSRLQTRTSVVEPPADPWIATIWIEKCITASEVLQRVYYDIRANGGVPVSGLRFGSEYLRDTSCAPRVRAAIPEDYLAITHGGAHDRIADTTYP